MKTLVLSMISIAATVAAMTACTSESDPINEITNPKDEKVEINVTAGILKVEAETKAAVTGNVLNGVQILRKDGKDDTGNWPTEPIVVDIKDNASNIFESTPQYYNPNGDNAYFIGFYPAGTVNESGIVSFTGLTGKEDVLLSDQLDAGKRGGASANRELTFSHKLALIKFTFKQGTGYPDGDMVTALTVKGVELPASMSLTDGAITYTTDKATSGLKAFDSGNYTINSAGTSINDDDALMVEPEKPITLDITTGKATFTVSKIKINNSESATTEAGKQYNITITFNGSQADATAIITPWGDAIAGEGTTE